MKKFDIDFTLATKIQYLAKEIYEHLIIRNRHKNKMCNMDAYKYTDHRVAVN